MTEVEMLPYYLAHDDSDRDRQSICIPHVVGLYHAVCTGLILEFTICWPKGRYLKMSARFS